MERRSTAWIVNHQRCTLALASKASRNTELILAMTVTVTHVRLESLVRPDRERDIALGNFPVERPRLPVQQIMTGSRSLTGRIEDIHGTIQPRHQRLYHVT